MALSEEGIFVTATDTEVGKTFISGLLIRACHRHGIKAGYFKPVATGCRRLEGGSLQSEDLLFIERITNHKLDHDLHCPLRYHKPLAPLAASQLEKGSIDLQLIRQTFQRLKATYSFLVVEGIGGVEVPIGEDYLVLDMMIDIGFPVLVVCRSTLGTINHSLLTLHAIQNRGIPIIGFLTNGHREKDDEAALTSPGLIAKFSHVEYLGHVPFYDPGETDFDSFIERKAPFLMRLHKSHSPSPRNQA
jgi:dethiobiotin synthetase